MVLRVETFGCKIS